MIMNTIIKILGLIALYCLLAYMSINQGMCQSAIANELVPNKEKHYILKSQNDFDKFITSLENGSTFKGDTIELITDVNGDNVSSVDRIFSGVFLGRNHKISNLMHPFVSTLKGTIDNFTIDITGRISGTENVASFCIRNDGILRKCTNYAQITGSATGESYMHIGGICSISYGTIINCINYGTVSATLNGNVKAVVRCGGITSFQQGNDIIACENYGTINASAYYYVLCGGINADQQGGHIICCTNHGIISSTARGASSSGGASSTDIIHYTGGIVGQAQEGALINRCKNFGSISNNTQYVGGIAGKVGNSDLYNLTNYGRVESVQGKFYSCAAGITGYTHAVNTMRHIYNCINKGDIVSYSQYGIATAAGVCPDIENCSLANLYSSGSVSAQRVGGTGTQTFEIHDYEYDSQSIELNKVEGLEQANSFVESDNSSKTRLLAWKQDDDGYSLSDYFYTFVEPSHGCVDFSIFFDTNNILYQVIVTNDETGRQYCYTGESPIRITQLYPNTSYSYDIHGITDESYDEGKFTTLSPNIVITTSSIGYDKIEFKQFCDAKGVDDIRAHLVFYDKENNPTKIEGLDSIIVVNERDEETDYSAYLEYMLNGKEYRSSPIDVTTNPIIPLFSLVSRTPYSLTLKCDNFEELKDFNPCLYVDDPRFYDFGGFKTGESRAYKLDNEGKVTLDSLLYGYSPQLYSQYTIHEKERFRKTDTFTTLNWGGEGIIQLSPNAAMIHGLFGGMGDRVSNGGYSDYYDRARFYYRDATASDNASESYIESACIAFCISTILVCKEAGIETQNITQKMVNGK